MSDSAHANTAERVASWPLAILFCVRHPCDHAASYRPMEDYPISSRSGVLGPVRGDRCGCGSLMYVAGVMLAGGRETTDA